MKVNFRVKRAENCVLIDTKKWIQNSTLGVYRMSGRPIPTYMAEVLSENLTRECFKNSVNCGDIVLISRVASDVSQYRAFAIEEEDKRYYNVPIMQILGVFEDKNICLSSLKLLFNKILVRKITPEYEGFIISPNDNTMIGEVLKVGTCNFTENWNPYALLVKIGDKVLIQDNVSTEIYFDGLPYYVVEEKAIVGIFKEGTKRFSLKDLKLINNYILLEEAKERRTDSTGSLLVTTCESFEDADYSELYNKDVFNVLGVDDKITKVEEGDTLLVDHFVTNYAYFQYNKYCIIEGLKDISAKIGE